VKFCYKYHVSLHKLHDGVARNITPHEARKDVFFSSLETPLSPEQYSRLVNFAKRCIRPVWDVSQKSALAQVSVNAQARNSRPLGALKYRAGGPERLGQLSVPMTLALASAYARQHFEDLLAGELEGMDLGRVYVYDAASALRVDEVMDLYNLPCGARALDGTTIGIPMNDVFYTVKNEPTPQEILYYATHGRQFLGHILDVHHKPLPSLAPNDTLISAFSIDGKTDRLPPTNIVLGIETTRRGVDHLRALLLDQGRIDVHHKSAGDHACSFQVELVNRTGKTLDQELVKDTLVTAKFYRTMDPTQEPHALSSAEQAVA
jgi:hypothetical protein